MPVPDQLLAADLNCGSILSPPLAPARQYHLFAIKLEHGACDPTQAVNVTPIAMRVTVHNCSPQEACGFIAMLRIGKTGWFKPRYEEALQNEFSTMSLAFRAALHRIHTIGNETSRIPVFLHTQQINDEDTQWIKSNQRFGGASQRSGERISREGLRRQEAGNRRQDRQGCRQGAKRSRRIEGCGARRIEPSPSTETSHGIDPDYRCITAAVWRRRVLWSQAWYLVNLARSVEAAT
jgi:hypothetical protein